MVRKRYNTEEKTTTKHEYFAVNACIYLHIFHIFCTCCFFIHLLLSSVIYVKILISILLCIYIYYDSEYIEKSHLKTSFLFLFYFLLFVLISAV